MTPPSFDNDAHQPRALDTDRANTRTARATGVFRLVLRKYSAGERIPIVLQLIPWSSAGAKAALAAIGTVRGLYSYIHDQRRIR